jgi:hypothetical protein
MLNTLRRAVNHIDEEGLLMGVQERKYRIKEVVAATGYTEATIRKKILRREIAHTKVGKIIVVSETEIARLLGDFRPALTLEP